MIIVRDPIYLHECYLFYGDSEKEATKNMALKLFKDEEEVDFDGASGFFLYNSSNVRKSIIWISKHKYHSELVGTLTHECFHLMDWVFSTRGVGHNKDWNEQWAYYLEFWVKNFYRGLIEQNKKRRLTSDTKNK